MPNLDALFIFWVTAVVFLPGCEWGRSEPQPEPELGTHGWLSLDKAAATRGDSYITGHHYYGTQFLMANDEYAFVIIGAVRADIGHPRVLGPDATAYIDPHNRKIRSDGWPEVYGGWRMKNGQELTYHGKFPSGDVSDGVMKIGNSQWSLADGRVFLVKPRGGADVQQVDATLVGNEVEEALKKLVGESDEVRAWLAADLTEGLQSKDSGRRSGAARFAYQCSLGGELKTALLVEFLKDDQGWVRLMAAEALWNRQQHEAAIPMLVALLQEKGEYLRRIVAWQSARVLGEIGPEAQAAAPALREAQNSDDQELRAEAVEALKKVEK